MAQMGILDALITHLSKTKTSDAAIADNEQQIASSLARSKDKKLATTTLKPSTVKLAQLTTNANLQTNDAISKSIAKQLEPQLTIPLFTPFLPKNHNDNNNNKFARKQQHENNGLANWQNNNHNNNNDDNNNNHNNFLGDSASWHWAHYKKPYGFNMQKSPTFHDYEYANNDNDDHYHRQYASIFDLTINLHPHRTILNDHLLKMMQQKLVALRTTNHKQPISVNNNNQHVLSMQQQQQPYIATVDHDPINYNPLAGEMQSMIIEKFNQLRNNQSTMMGATNYDHLAQLSCDSGEMIVRLNFTEPFKGIVYPDHNRLSPCRFFGDGHHNYELRLPLRGCGTRQAAPRVFVNDVIVRFHRSLELEEDEVKTLICRYPAPQAPLTIAGQLGPANMNSNGLPFDNLSHHQTDQFEFIDNNHRQGNHNNPKNSMTHIDTISDNLLVATPPSPLQDANANYQNYPNSNQHTHYQQSNLNRHNTSANLQNFNNINTNNNANSYGNDSWLEPWQIVNTNNLTSPGSNLNPLNNYINDISPQKNSQLIDHSASQTNNRLINPNSSGNNGLSHQNTTKLISASPIELLLLISSIMFLVLLALAFMTSYYCFQRRRRRHLSSRANALAVAAATSNQHHLGGHFNPKIANSSSTLISNNSTNLMCDPNILAAYGPPMNSKHMQNHYQQQGRRLAGTNRTFWAPAGSTRGGRQAGGVSGPENEPIKGQQSNVQRGRRTHHYVNRAFDYSGEPGRPMQQIMDNNNTDNINSDPGSGFGLNKRWPNESQLVDAHLRDQPGSHHRLTQFRVPDVDHYSGGQQRAGPEHMISGSAAYALVEPRNLRNSEQQVWHNFESSTSPSDGDNVSGLGGQNNAEIDGLFIMSETREPKLRDHNRYVPPLNRAHSYHSPSTLVKGDRSYHGRQQSQHNQNYGPFDPISINKQNLHDQHDPQSNRNRLRNLSKQQQQQEDKQQEYVYWNEQKSYYNHESMQQHHRVSFAHQKHQYPLANQAGGVLTSASSTTGDSGHSLPSTGDAINTCDLSDGSPPPHQQQTSNDNPPRLVVKSIEDSFIKKFTEIESQEYMSRDSRQVLSLAEWRQCLAKANAIASNQQGQKMEPNEPEKRRIAADSQDEEDNMNDHDDDSWQDSGELDGSNLAHLRSLSEVDISFAKPAAMSNQNTAKRKGIDKNPASNNVADSQLRREATLENRPNIESRDDGPSTDPIDTANSPDLIISPEYKVDDDSYHQVRQLRLRSQNNNNDDRTGTNRAGHHSRVDSPSNSVSYV